MNVLIVYGTTEGHTQKVAERVGARLLEQGHTVETRNAETLMPSFDPGTFDAVIVAASVHQDRHQEPVSDFVSGCREQMNSKPTAFISVSLSVVLDETRDEAQACVDRFMTSTGWKTPNVLLLGGAVRGSEYDYFQRQIVKFIVMKRGGLADLTRDYEFTDWNALDGFIDEFLVGAHRPL